MQLRLTYNYSRGVTLIEALIAMVILAVGILSVANFQGSLISSSGLNMARAEAMQLAQSKIEEFRATVTKAEYDEIQSGDKEIPGENASTFDLEWVVTNANPNRKDITVTVSWEDPKEGTQVITMNTTVSWVDPQVDPAGDSLALGSGSVPPPGSNVQFGGEQDYTDIPEGAQYDTDTGHYLYERSDGKFERIDTEGRVVRTFTDRPSYIRGTVYIEVDNSGSIFIMGTGNDPSAYVKNYLFITPTDDCFRLIDDPLTPHTVGGEVKYRSFDYVCELPPDWASVIGLEQVEDADIISRVCVGDSEVPFPQEVDDDGNPIDVTSRHAALTTFREYRGYGIDSLGRPILTGHGLGMDNGIYSHDEYTHHNFMIVDIRLGGASEPEDFMDLCNEKMGPSGLMTRLDGQDDNTHPGQFFCLSDDCSDHIYAGAAPTTTISGVINRINSTGNNRALLDSIDMDEGVCTFHDTSHTEFQYSCEIDWRGSVGRWNDNLTFELTTGHEFCLATASGSAIDLYHFEPHVDGSIATFSIAEGEPGLSAQDRVIELDFSIRHPDAAICPTE